MGRSNDKSWKKVKEEALVRSKRSCCICRKFCGRPAEVHHIKEKSEGGLDTLDNAIVLCERCHEEVGHYNHRHPRGNKYSPAEVRRHRDDWWAWCDANPLAPPPKHPIHVSPHLVEYQLSEWSARHVISLRNRSRRELYAAQVLFEVANGDLSSDLQIGPAQMGGKPENLCELKGITVDASMFAVGYADGGLCFQIAQFDPGESIKFTVDVAKCDPAAPRYGSKGVLSIQIPRFSYTAEPAYLKLKK